MELNREEIIKALECCASEEYICTQCPIDEKIKDDCECGKVTARNALALINKLTKENERLRAELEQRQPKLIITKLPKKRRMKMFDRKAYGQKYSREKRERRKAEGRCVTCGVKLTFLCTTLQCEHCREKQKYQNVAKVNISKLIAEAKSDTIHKLKRDLYVEFLYLARCQKDDEPNMTSQEVFDALDRVTKRHLDVSGNDNRCVSCGEIIPEGRQVCPLCECKRSDEGR